jgi:hypothetical protein
MIMFSVKTTKFGVNLLSVSFDFRVIYARCYGAKADDHCWRFDVRNPIMNKKTI